MATTGEITFTQASTTNESPHLDEPWVSPTNALQENNTYASVTAGTFDSGDQTAILRTYNASTALAAAIPADAQSIDGVIVRINGYSDHLTNVLFDLVQLLDATGALSGTNLAAGEVAMGTDAGAVHVFGSSTEKWGLGAGLTRALLIDAQFGVGIGVIARQANSQCFVDVVTIEVVYTPAHVPTTVYGQVALTSTVSVASVAKMTAKAQAQVALTVTRVTQAIRTAFAQVAATHVVQRSTEGRRGVLAQSALVLTVSSATQAVREAHALVELPIGVVISTEGTAETPPAGETKYAQVAMALGFDAQADGHLFVLANPAADSVDGAWTNQDGGSDLEGSIDEDAPVDSDYIRSELRPSASACRIKLEPISDPGSGKWHALRWRIAKDAAEGDDIALTIRLMEGGGDALGAGTEIASFTRLEVEDSFQTFEEALSEEQGDAITDHSALYVEIEATASF